MISDFEDFCIFIILSVVTVISISALLGTVILAFTVLIDATVFASYVTVTNVVNSFIIGWISIIAYCLLYASHEQHKRDKEEREVQKRCFNEDPTPEEISDKTGIPVEQIRYHEKFLNDLSGDEL